MKKTKYMATIYDGNTYIERRVYEDEKGFRYAKINRFLFDVDYELPKWYDIQIWKNEP